MPSRPEDTPGAQEISDDRNAGIAAWRTPIGRQRYRGSVQTWWGRIKPYGHCASQQEIGIPIDAGVGGNGWPGRLFRVSTPRSFTGQHSRIHYRYQRFVIIEREKGSRSQTFTIL
jgi:hypothetical protein